MKKIKIRLILSVLALALLLSACSGQPRSETENTTAGSSTSETNPREVNSTVDDGMVLVAESLELPDGMAYSSAQCLDGDTIWLGGLSENGAVFGSVGLDGESGPVISMPENCEFVYAMCAVDGGIAVLAGSFPSAYKNSDGDTVMNDYPEGRLELLIFDGNDFVNRTELAANEYAGERVRLMLESGGSYYLLCQYAIVKFGSDGVEQAKFTLDTGDNLDYLASMCLCDGQLLAASGRIMGSDVDTILYHLNLSTLSEEKTTTIEGAALTGLGVDKSGHILALSDEGMFTVNSNGERDVNILNWKDLYITDTFISADELEDGYLFFPPNRESICTAQYADLSEETAERIELTIAADNVYIGSAAALANAFNTRQDKYYITVNAYDGFGGIQEKSLDLLRTEIIAGNTPDIFAFTMDESLSEIKPDVLYIDLSEYLDNEESFSRDDFFEVQLDAVSKNGALYWLPYRFTVETFTAPESLIGSSNLSLEEVKKIASDNGLPMFSPWMTKEDVLYWASRLAVDKYIDWENATCSFDSDGFVQLLRLCGECGSESESLVEEEHLLEWELLQGIWRLSVISRNYNGNYRFIGFPTGDDKGCVFQFELKFAISANSENKDAAWEFISFAMSEEGQEAYTGAGFCTLRPMLSAEIEDAVENGAKDLAGDLRYEFSEADAEKFWGLVSRANTLASSNSVITDIIREEARAYFAGNKTAEECAGLIQSRVKLYVAEQS